MKLKKVGYLFDTQETNNISFRKDHFGEYKLYDKNELIMYETDDVLNLYNNSIKDIDIKGDILILGLGFGLIPYNFNELDGVKHITVIENNIGVINFVKPIMPWIEFIHIDAFEFETDRLWDTIFMDIFHKKTENYENDQLRLISKYSKMVNNNLSYLKIHNIKFDI